jgi:hypothetical protein
MRALKEHRSDIARAAERYIESMRAADKVSPGFPQVLYLFIEYLSLHIAEKTAHNPDRILRSNWAQCSAKMISGFTDHWMPQVILNHVLAIHAPSILRRWMIWCYKQGYFSRSALKDYLGVLPREKGRDIERLIRAGELLHELHCPDKALWKEKRDRVIQLNLRKSPQEEMSGRMIITELNGDKAFFRTQQGVAVGPVLIGKPLARLLKIGDVLQVEIARFGACWHVLNSGAVFAGNAVSAGLFFVNPEPEL